MTAMPCLASSGVITIGGTTCSRLKCVNGQTPPALQAAASSFIGDSLNSWRQCQGKNYYFGPATTSKFLARDAVDVAGTIVATAVQNSVPSYHCVHVLSAVDQFVVGARTCGLADDKAPALVARLKDKTPK